MASGTTPGEHRRSGRCKWFNVVKGYGFITPHDGGPEVFLHQTVIQMQGFRSLAEGEEVEFECRDSEKGVEATFVCGPEGSDCRGSERRPVSKKKFRKLRCYNCGDFANHIAAKCPRGPLPKRCHHCKSDGHLIADCPSKKAETGISPTGSTPTSHGVAPVEHSPESSSQQSGNGDGGSGGESGNNQSGNQGTQAPSSAETRS